MSDFRRAPWMIAAVAALVCGSSALALNDLSLNVTPASVNVMPGDTVTVTLDMANLSASINGVQTRLQYDPSILSLLSIVPTNLGVGGWIEVNLTDNAGSVDFAVVINGGSTFGSGTVATLIFAAVGEGTTSVTFRPDSPPFQTKFTVASDNTTLLPTTTDSGTLTSDCSDGLFCNGLEVLVGASCQAGLPPDCTVLTDQCNDGVCNNALGACEAVPANEGLGCNDGDLCTINDTCTSGACVSTPLDCSSLDDPCNLGTCNALTGICEPQPSNEGGSCDDGVFCNGADTCNTGVCVSAGDPCVPLFCEEAIDLCVAPLQVTNMEVFYAGKFADQNDPSHTFLAEGSTATVVNVTNYMRGITGIRLTFGSVVTFATTPEAAFTFEWTTGTGSVFTPIDNPATEVTITPVDQGGFTEVTIVLTDDHVRRRWLKVTIDATQVLTSGVELDGELVGAPITLPSGDGLPGGDAVFFLGNLTGDVDGDLKTRLGDIGLARAEVNPFLSVPITNVFDVDRDGKVRLGDIGDARADVNPFYKLPLISP